MLRVHRILRLTTARRILRRRQPTARSQADKVIALKKAGVSRLQIQEQLSISKASYYRILKENAA